MTFPNFEGPLNEIKKPLSQLQLAAERLSIFADDRGAIGDGSTDDSTAINAAIDELAAAGGGTLMGTPGKIYLASELAIKRKVDINLNRSTFRAKTTAGNILFRIQNNVVSTKTLSSAVRYATSITVSSTSGISVGDAVIVSAGTWTGSGPEHGPYEWNEVKTVTDSTHLVLKTPLKYSYTAMGMTGAAPILQVFGPATSLIAYNRIYNGFIDVNGTDNPLFFGVINTQHVEIDHITMLAKGSIPLLVNYTSDLKFHHNVGIGPSKDADVFCSAAGLVESSITDNFLNFQQATSGGKENSLVCEVMTRDCEIARNFLFGIDGTNGAVIALNMTFGCFNTRFENNRIFGINLSNSFDTKGIRTYENQGNASNFGANIFRGNVFTNLLYGIADAQIPPETSLVEGNRHANDTVASFSAFLVSLDDYLQVGNNSLKNINIYAQNPSSVGIRVRHLPGGDLGTIYGTGSPESVVTAPIGMRFIRRDGGAGTILYVKESGSGNTGWVAYGGAGSFQPLDSDLTAIAALSTTSFGRGLLALADAAALRTAAALGTVATLDSDTDGTLAANSDANVATQKAVKTYVDTAVTGLLDFKGSTNASGNPNYPAASKGDAYVVSTAGKIGGASGKSVDVSDVYVASADNAGGTEASVGTSWFVLEHNLVGALLAANNLSDLSSASTARTNLGLGNVANVDTTNAGNISAGTLPDARLSSAIPRLNQANTFTSGQQAINLSAGSTCPWYVHSSVNGNNIAYFQNTHTTAGYGMLVESATNSSSVYNFRIAGNTSRDDFTVYTDGSVTVGSPTGGPKGAGSINAVTVWRNGTSLDFVFEDDYKLPSIDEMTAFFKKHKHLPTIPTREVNVEGSTNEGALTDRLWETIEVQARYIAELNERLKKLEKG